MSSKLDETAGEDENFRIPHDNNDELIDTFFV